MSKKISTFASDLKKRYGRNNYYSNLHSPKEYNYNTNNINKCADTCIYHCTD